MAKIFDKNLLSNFKKEEGKIGDQNEKDDLIEESVDSIFSSSYDSSNEQKKIEKIEKVKKRVKKKSCY
jgi:ribose 5-phosphate isomerase RpiB